MNTVCRVFGIKRSSYYDYRLRKDLIAPDREQLKARVEQLVTGQLSDSSLKTAFRQGDFSSVA